MTIADHATTRLAVSYEGRAAYVTVVRDIRRQAHHAAWGRDDHFRETVAPRSRPLDAFADRRRGGHRFGQN